MQIHHRRVSESSTDCARLAPVQDALDEQEEEDNAKNGVDGADNDAYGGFHGIDDDDDPSLPLRVIPCLGCARKLARKDGLGTRCRRLTTSNRSAKRCSRCNFWMSQWNTWRGASKSDS